MAAIRRNTDTIRLLAGICTLKADSNKGLTQTELAELANIDRSTVGRIVRSHPGFKRSLFPQYPRSYWFDMDIPILAHDGIDPENPHGSPPPIKNKLIELGFTPIGEVRPEFKSLYERFLGATKEQRATAIKALAETLEKFANNKLEADRVDVLLEGLHVTTAFIEHLRKEREDAKAI